VPTLVLHGEADPLIGVSGGRATAAAVPGARLVTFPGMGHDLPEALWPEFVAQIGRTVAQGEADRA
jgi:pimeloyl-ACP methyl ester carboxylesterase